MAVSSGQKVAGGKSMAPTLAVMALSGRERESLVQIGQMRVCALADRATGLLLQKFCNRRSGFMLINFKSLLD